MRRLLTPDHGFPCRLIIPGHIGGRMVKWLEVRRGEQQLNPNLNPKPTSSYAQGQHQERKRRVAV